MSKKNFSKKRRQHHVNIPAVVAGAASAVQPTEIHHSPQQATMMGYGPQGYEEIALTNTADIFDFTEKWQVVWIDVDGLGNAPLNEALTKTLNLDRLVMEDVFDTSHFPKMEEYDNYIFMVLKNGIVGDVFQTEQVSMILTRKLVVTFQERPGDSFNQLRQRIRGGQGRICKFASDYLAYAIIDAVVESYYPILESMKQRLDAVEDIFIEGSSRNVIRQIHDIKNDLLFLHSAIWPIYNITLVLSHDEDNPIITAATSHYLRDCQDQAKRVSDLSEFYRMIASDLMNTYLAFNDSKANEVMKVLTMVATVFIPLSFISSLYGMNFDHSVSPYNMPELTMRYGYPVTVLVMLTIASCTMLMFWRKGWLGFRGSDDDACMKTHR